MRKIILMYHGIGPIAAEDRMGLNTPLHKFVQEIEMLTRQGWKLGTIQALLGKNMPASSYAAISFDDALQNQLLAAEYLDSIKVKATFFVPTGCLGSNLGGKGYWSAWKCMKASDVERLSASGHEIGSHGSHHRGPLHHLPTHEIEKELSESRGALANLTGANRLGFSYPYGGFTESLARMVQNAGYEYGAGSRPGSVTTNNNLFGLPRIEIRGRDSKRTIGNKISGSWETLRILRHLISTTFRGWVKR